MAALLTVALVLLLAAAGGVVRWQLGEGLNRTVPWGTLTANLTAAFALGALSGLDGRSDLIVRVGLLGALSTWSTLANEVATMVRQSNVRLAAQYVTCSVCLGVAFAWFGLRLMG